MWKGHVEDSQVLQASTWRITWAWERIQVVQTPFLRSGPKKHMERFTWRHLQVLQAAIPALA